MSRNYTIQELERLGIPFAKEGISADRSTVELEAIRANMAVEIARLRVAVEKLIEVTRDTEKNPEEMEQISFLFPSETTTKAENER